MLTDSDPLPILNMYFCGCSVARSWITECFPIVIGPRSPRSTAPYHTELYSSKLTSPMMHAFGATNCAESMLGFRF